MNDKDASLISDVKKKIIEITTFNKMDADWEFTKLANDLLNILSSLSESEDEDIKRRADMAWDSVSHTISKEVSFIDHYSKKMNKKNAPNKSRTDYKNSIKDSAHRLNMDVSGLLY